MIEEVSEKEGTPSLLGEAYPDGMSPTVSTFMSAMFQSYAQTVVVRASTRALKSAIPIRMYQPTLQPSVGGAECLDFHIRRSISAKIDVNPIITAYPFASSNSDRILMIVWNTMA